MRTEPRPVLVQARPHGRQACPHPQSGSARAAAGKAPRDHSRKGPHNGDWLRNTMRLPPQEQQKRLEQDQHFRQLPRQHQEQLRNRLQTFNSMPPNNSSGC